MHQTSTPTHNVLTAIRYAIFVLFSASSLLTACDTGLDCEGAGLVESQGRCVPGHPDGGASTGDGGGDACAGDCEADHADGSTDGDKETAGCPEAASDPADHDGDGTPDACDADDDDDGIEDRSDACPLGADGLDTDGDGCVDEGEDTDDDDDRIDDDEDNCPLDENRDQRDHDGDGQGDVCDADDDDDGVGDADDACPLGATLGRDSDGDGCKDDGEDDDDDDDGLADEDDLCPTVAASEVDDIDGDGCPLGDDACPTGGYLGPDSDADGCLDIEDPASQSAGAPGVPRVLHVDASASVEGADGKSWDTAFPFLRDALAEGNRALEDGSVQTVEVWLAEGTYYPDESASGDVEDDPLQRFEPRSGTKLVGGFRQDDDGAWKRDVAAAETILSGDIDHESAEGADVNVVVAPEDLSPETIGIRVPMPARWSEAKSSTKTCTWTGSCFKGRSRAPSATKKASPLQAREPRFSGESSCAPTSQNLLLLW